MHLSPKERFLAIGMLLFIPFDYVFNTYLVNVYVILYIIVNMRTYITDFDFSNLYSFLFLQSIIFILSRLLKELGFISPLIYTLAIICPFVFWLCVRDP